MKFVLYDWAALNVWLFHIINNWRGSFIDKIMVLGSQLGAHENYPLYVAAAVIVGLVAILFNRSQEDLALKWLAAIAIFSCGYLIDGEIITCLKHAMNFPRPIVALSGILHVVGAPEYQYSFPSGHAAFVMLVVMSFWCVVHRPLRIALMIFVIWVGISRVNLGDHFPADVMAGFLISLGVIYVLRRFVDRILFSQGRMNSGRNTT